MAGEYKIVTLTPKVVGAAMRLDWSDAERDLNGLVGEGWRIDSSSVGTHGVTVMGFGSQTPALTLLLHREGDGRPA